MSITNLKVMFAAHGQRWLLGALVQTGRRVAFEFSAQAKDRRIEVSPLRAPVATTGPVAGHSEFGGLPGCIADSLPDGMGALSFEPADEIEDLSSKVLSLVSIARDTRSVLNDDAEQDEVEQLSSLLVLGGSPQGARPKALARCSAVDQRWRSGHDPSSGSPWLLNGGVKAADAKRSIDRWIEALQPRTEPFAGLSIRPKTLKLIRDRTTPVWRAIANT